MPRPHEPLYDDHGLYEAVSGGDIVRAKRILNRLSAGDLEVVSSTVYVLAGVVLEEHARRDRIMVPR